MTGSFGSRRTFGDRQKTPKPPQAEPEDPRGKGGGKRRDHKKRRIKSGGLSLSKPQHASGEDCEGGTGGNVNGLAKLDSLILRTENPETGGPRG